MTRIATLTLHDWIVVNDPLSPKALNSEAERAKLESEIERDAVAQQRAIAAKHEASQRANAAHADAARREADARHAKKERARPLQEPGSPFD